MDLHDLDARLDRLESEAAIRRLAHEYCHGADKRDLERFSSVWHPDAVWAVSASHAFRGRDQIVAAVQAQWDEFSRMVHLTGNHVVHIDGDAGVGEADVDVTVVPTSGGIIRACGTYRDTYRRDDRRWWIIRRDAEVLVRWEGAVPTNYVPHDNASADDEARSSGC